MKRLALQLTSVKKKNQPHVLRWTFPKDFPPYIYQGRSPCCSMLHTSIGCLLRCHSWSSKRMGLTCLNIHHMIIIRKSLYKVSIYFYLRAGIKSWLNCLEKLSFFGSWKRLPETSEWGKHLCECRISNIFQHSMPPDLGKTQRAFPILCLGVKPSFPPSVQNLNDTQVFTLFICQQEILFFPVTWRNSNFP